MEEKVSTTEAAEAAFSTFRRQQRRPSNLLQCMDKDGNIDAFRYIEYSRQRRMAFLKRADFICKMKSTLRLQQQQQQQQLHRSASLPGMTGLSGVASSQANATFTNTVSPEMLHKSLGRRNSMGTINMAPVTTGAVVPDALRYISRSTSMPFVASLASNTLRRASLQKNATFETKNPNPHHRSLRKEEFEAAEALLFGMTRGSQKATSDEKRPSESALKENEETSKTSERPPCSKKQKREDPRTEEVGSVFSVVSTEEEASGSSSSSSNVNIISNSNSMISSTNSNSLQEDEGIAIKRVKSTESSD